MYNPARRFPPHVLDLLGGAARLSGVRVCVGSSRLARLACSVGAIIFWLPHMPHAPDAPLPSSRSAL